MRWPSDESTRKQMDWDDASCPALGETWDAGSTSRRRSQLLPLRGIANSGRDGTRGPHIPLDYQGDFCFLSGVYPYLYPWRSFVKRSPRESLTINRAPVVRIDGMPQTVVVTRESRFCFCRSRIRPFLSHRRAVSGGAGARLQRLSLISPSSLLCRFFKELNGPVLLATTVIL